MGLQLLTAAQPLPCSPTSARPGHGSSGSSSPRPAWARLWTSLRGLWRQETLIHGDIKSDNILVGTPLDRHEAPEETVWIVDWEFVEIGDPAWDLASALTTS